MEPSSEGPELFLWSLIVGRMVMEPSSEEIRSLGHCRLSHKEREPEIAATGRTDAEVPFT
jgi:hypothetical protein